MLSRLAGKIGKQKVMGSHTVGICSAHAHDIVVLDKYREITLITSKSTYHS